MKKTTLLKKLSINSHEMYWSFSIFMFLLFSGFNLSAQTVLLNPNGDGGFENGATFAANGWTAVNGTTNTWNVGTVPGWFTGTGGAYVSNDAGVTWGYNNATLNRSHFYRDVTFPAGAASVVLNFDWRGNGNDTTWDNLLVYIMDTSITPTTAGPTGTNTTTTGWTGYTNGTSGYYLLQRNGTAVPSTTTNVSYTLTAAQLSYVSGSTKRLVFVWKNDGSGGANPPASVDNISVVAFTCQTPTAANASSITTTSANLGWTAPASAPSNGYEYELRTSGAAGSGATGLVSSGSTAAGVVTTSFSGLASNTSHTFYVRSNCGGGDYSSWTSTTFFTGYCQPSSSNNASYINNFSTTGGATNISNLASGYTTGGYQDNYNTLSVSQYASGSINFASDIVGGTVGTSIWVDWNNDLVFSNTTERVFVTSAYGNNQTGSFIVPNGTPLGNYRMRIRIDYNAIAPDACSNTNARTEAEDYKLTVIAPPSCVPPSSLTATAVTSSTATFQWVENGTATLWNVEYGFAGFTQGLGTLVNGVTNPFPVSGLAPNTAYQYYVKADCGGSGTSTWSGPYSFTTLCNPYTIPYFEGFESGYTHNTAVGGCLSQASVTGAAVWTANSSLTDYNRSPRTGSWNAFLQYSNDDWLFIPINLTSGTSYTVSLYVRQDGATAANSNVAISYGTAASAAGMTNVIVAPTGIVNGTYQQIMGAFTPSSTGTFYVGIKGYMNSTPWYISLDDISIDLSPSCIPPTGLAASSVTYSSAALTWAPTTGSYEYVLDQTAADPAGSGTPWSGESYNASSLNGLTTYYFHVRTVCAGPSYSTWSTVSFTTLVTPPANDNFANAAAIVCGNNYSGDTTNASIDEDNAPDGFSADLDARNVWYKYTGSGSAETVTLNLCGSSYDTSVLVYTGTSGALTLVAANDDDGTCTSTTRSKVSFNSDGTTTYYITIEGWNSGNYGLYTMDVTCAAVNPPAVSNQDCGSALAVNVDGIAINSDNSYGTVNATQPSCDTFGTIQDVWFSFVAPTSGSVDCSVSNTTITSSNFTVYSGACGSLVEMTSACNSNLTAPTTESMTGLVAGNTYFVQVWSNAAEQGTFSISLTEPTAGTGTFDMTSFKAYPNPVKDLLNLSYASEISYVSVYNMLGQEVMSKTVNAAQSQLDMSGLNSGNYIVKVVASGLTKTIKVIKQ